jgi:hypothetical protein
MLFLIEYNREQGRIVTIESYKDSDRKRAYESLLQLELDLNRKGSENEVVLLDAATEDAVRRTHRRYFENLAQLTTAPTTGHR